jgi:futalosine hydrolase
MTVLVVAAVDAEARAVRDGDSAADVLVVVAGVGPVAAATATAHALATGDYDLVISAGIAGGFPGRAGIGDVIVATGSIAADLGCRTDEGFLSLGELGLAQPSRLDFDAAASWHDRLAKSGLPVVAGDVVTLSCMTGTDADGESLAARFPAAVGESMEGWGVAWAAHSAGVPAGEVRTVSNLIGRRDPTAWDLKGALDALARAFAVLLSEPLS